MASWMRTAVGGGAAAARRRPGAGCELFVDGGMGLMAGGVGSAQRQRFCRRMTGTGGKEAWRRMRIGVRGGAERSGLLEEIAAEEERLAGEKWSGGLGDEEEDTRKEEQGQAVTSATSGVAQWLVLAALLQSLGSPTAQPSHGVSTYRARAAFESGIVRSFNAKPMALPGARIVPRWTIAGVLWSISYALGIARPRTQKVPAEIFDPQVYRRDVTADPGRILGAALLIAGGTVGAGIVALPITTAPAGFLPSAAALVAGWAFMYSTALLVVEVSRYCGPSSNFTSMAEQTLGRHWKMACALLYVFIYGATLTAYVSESANYIIPAIASVTGVVVPAQFVSALFTVFFGAIIYIGSEAVDQANRLCLAIALAAYAGLIGLGGGVLQTSSLMYSNWPAAISTVPIVIVAFTFHNIIPSLFAYLGSARAVRQSLLLGTLIPLGMYLTWEALILGSLPAGTVLESVSEIVSILATSASTYVVAAIQVFSLFAIITSFLGVGMGCVDFLKDLIRKPQGHSQQRELGPLVLTLAPPLIVAWACPSLFVSALEISGVLRVVLFGLMPALMAWAGPFRNKMSVLRSSGLLGIIAMSLYIIGIEIFGKLAVL